MPVRAAEDLIEIGTVIGVGSVDDNADRAVRSSTFHGFLNGSLHSIVRGSEAFLRDTVIALAQLHPEDSWGYAPVPPSLGIGP